MGKSRFTKDQVEIIKKLLEEKTTPEILDYIKTNFNQNMTPHEFKSWRANHKVKVKNRFLYNKGKCWIPAEHVQYIKDHVHEYEAPILAKKLNELYGTNYTGAQIKTFKNNHKIYGFLGTGGYNENRPNPHKNQKGWHVKNSEKTRFQKGHEPANTAELYEERKTTDGYIVVKLGYKNWAFKHRLIWEKENGKIPAGSMIVFLDGNKENCELSNLMLVSNKENATTRTIRALGSKELSTAAIYTTRIKGKLSDKEGGKE